MEAQAVRVLLIEDDRGDYLITRRLLSKVSRRRFELDWVTNYEAGLEAICAGGHDVCLLDYFLGPRNGLDLLRDANARGCKVPIILLTGQGCQEVDLAAMEAGAADFLVKGEISPSQLERSIRYSIEQRRLLLTLRDALAQIKTLQGIIPICSYCKRIRDDQDFWEQLEAYVSAHTEAQFSHGICPSCYEGVVKSELQRYGLNPPEYESH